MSIEKARECLRRFGAEERILEFDVSSATVDLAAAALGVDGARIAKTLSFKKDDGCFLVVAAGDARIDNRKFKDTFSCKAKMLTPEEAESMIGHSVGGVCPFGRNEGVPVWLDASLRRPDFENERVNQPADPNHHWRFRFHLPLSVLNSEKASELRVQIEGLIKDSNRFA